MMKMSWKAFWAFLFAFSNWRKGLWIFTLLLHIPSIAILPELDDVCFAGNFSRGKTHSEVVAFKSSLEFMYTVTIQSIVLVVFACYVYLLFSARLKHSRDQQLVDKLAKINNPAEKSAEIWKLVRFVRPFDYTLFGSERGIVIVESLFMVLLGFRFCFQASCAMRGGTIFNLETSEVVGAEDLFLNASFNLFVVNKNVTDILPKDIMPNAAFILANLDLFSAMVLAILAIMAVELPTTLVVFLTPTFRARVLESLCAGSDGKLAARFVARDLSLRRLWCLCAIGLKSPKHFTHAVVAIRKELEALNQRG